MVLIMDFITDASIAALAVYHAIGARIICGFAVTAVTATTRVGLTWSGVLVMVVG